MYSVAIVAEQPVSRAGLEKVASEDDIFRVVASAASLDHAAGWPEPVDVVVLDVPLAGAAMSDAVTHAAGVGKPLVASRWDASEILPVVRAGARGCISHRTEQDDIRQALRVVAAGGFYLCPLLVERFQREVLHAGDDGQPRLAPREVETLRWIALGFTHSQIATRMGLSHATVNTYAKRIRAKLNVNNKAELTRMAIELGHLDQSRQKFSAA